MTFYLDGIESTYFETFGATGTCYCAILFGNSALVLVNARYKNLSVFLVLSA